MRVNNNRSFFVSVFLGALLSMPLFAGELEEKLESIFDDVVLNNKLTKENLKDLSTSGKTIVFVKVNEQPEPIVLSANKLNGVHLTSFKNNFKKHQNPSPALNGAGGEFQITYSYSNLYGGIVDYRVTFIGEPIRTFCTSAPHCKLAVQIELPDSTVNTPLLSTIASAISAPLLRESNDSSVSQHEDTAYYSCDDDDDEGFAQSCVVKDSPKAAPSTRIRLLSSTLTDMGVLFNKALVVGGEADHVWALVANGTRGFLNLYAGFTNFNLCSAAVGVADMASAVAGSVRLCRALNGASAQTHELFRELDSKLDLISEISGEMAEVLDRVKSGIGQVNLSLEKSIRLQSELLAQWSTANSESDETVQKAISLLKSAQIKQTQTRERIRDIAIAAETIDAGWERVKGQLESLGELPAQDAAEVLSEKELVARKLETIQFQIKEIQGQISLLEEPMKLVNEFIVEIADLNESNGAYFADSIKYLVETLEIKARVEQDCQLLTRENQELKECLRLNTTTENDVAQLQAQQSRLEQTANEAGLGVVLLKAAVDKKYDLKHLVVGASVAVLLASVLTVGALPAAGLGLITAHSAKTVDYAFLRGDEAEVEFHTTVGLLAHRFGVSKSFIQGVGAKLGYAYK